MNIREEIQSGTDNPKWLSDQDLQQDDKLYPQTTLKVHKDKKGIDMLFLQKKNQYIFGTLPKVDFKLDHPSISKNHAAIVFSSEMQVILYDLNSTHGTKLYREGKEHKIEALTPYIL